MNRLIIPILGLALVLALAGCSGPSSGQQNYQAPTGEVTNNSPAQFSGRMVVGLTDAAADMGSVSAIDVTVDKVEAHSQQGGWITLSEQSRTYDLLELRDSNNTVVLADVNLDAGTYDQVRLQISKVLVTDTSGVHEAKLPSGELKIVGTVTVDENSTAAVTFDLLADKSLHMTGNGEYIFTPVVKFATNENAEVTINGQNVTIHRGRLVISTTVSMDASGNIVNGIAISSDANLALQPGLFGSTIIIINNGGNTTNNITNIVVQGATMDFNRFLFEELLRLRVNSASDVNSTGQVEIRTQDVPKIVHDFNQYVQTQINITQVNNGNNNTTSANVVIAGVVNDFNKFISQQVINTGTVTNTGTVVIDINEVGQISQDFNNLLQSNTTTYNNTTTNTNSNNTTTTNTTSTTNNTTVNNDINAGAGSSVVNETNSANNTSVVNETNSSNTSSNTTAGGNVDVNY